MLRKRLEGCVLRSGSCRETELRQTLTSRVKFVICEDFRVNRYFLLGFLFITRQHMKTLDIERIRLIVHAVTTVSFTW